jgi:hypothetical protein
LGPEKKIYVESQLNQGTTFSFLIENRCSTSENATDSDFAIRIVPEEEEMNEFGGDPAQKEQ